MNFLNKLPYEKKYKYKVKIDAKTNYSSLIQNKQGARKKQRNVKNVYIIMSKSRNITLQL